MDEDTFSAAMEDAQRHALVRLGDAIERQNRLLTVITVLLFVTVVSLAVAGGWMWMKLDAMQFLTNVMH